MTVTVSELNYTEIDLCENVTYNNGDGTDGVDYKEGSYSVYKTLKASGNNDFTFTPSSSIDMSGTGVHLRFWGLFMQGSLITNIQVGITDGSNTGYWVLATGAEYPGGWYNFVVDVSGTVDSGTKPTSMNAITTVTVRVVLSGTAKNFVNTWIDHVCLCDGLIAYGDDAGGSFDWENIYTAENTPTSTAVGVLKKFAGVYYACGGFRIGDSASTNSCDFNPVSQTLVFEDREVNSSLYEIEVVDNGTGTTEFQLGTKAGTAGVSGGVITLADLTQTAVWNLDAKTDTDVDNFKMYGAVLLGASGMTFPSDATNVEVINCTFEECGQIDPDTCDVTNCSIISADSSQGGILIDTASHNVTGLSIINSTYGAEFNTDGAYGITDWVFTNNTNDIENSSAATAVDSYQPTEDGDVDVYSGSIIRVSQQFTGTAGDLSRATFSIRKQNSPTGNITATLYANSGGSPTGTALATSNNVDITGLTTSFADVDFEFEDEYTLVAATEYHIAIEYSGGDSTNRLEVEYLTAGSGSEACNTYTSSWSTQTYDCRFAVYRDGIVTVNATDSNPSSATETNATKGATIIVNTVAVTVTVVKASDPTVAISGVQTAVHLKNSPFTMIMNEDTNVSGVATEDYNYTADVDIVIKCRKSDDLDDPRYKAYSTTGKITSSGFSLTVLLEENTFI